MDLAAFIAKWSESSAAERANKDLFLIELCDVLDVPRPDPASGDPSQDRYVFERDVIFVAEGQKLSVGKIDLFKENCFLLEAKQGSKPGSVKLGTAKRNTPAWQVAMRDAFGQALGYARTFDRPPPILVTCDIGYCFDIYAAFDGSGDYRPFPNAQSSRIFLRDLADHAGTIRAVFLDPASLDPARHAAKVTREVAGHLAELARELEEAGDSPEIVATFLMRCLFTMFAEDVGLLPERIFTKQLEDEWIPHPERFRVGLLNLWNAMNEGGWWPTGKLLRFNGGLFATQETLPLTRAHLERLLEAARCDWSQVEPAIFGTLLERALDPQERHALGAHYTPRAYVERLVRPTIEEPLRAEWAVVQAEVRQLVEQGKVAPAEKVVHAFHQRLCGIRVLDPACGSGNFLYVTLDLFKRLESEILALLFELSGNVTLADVQTVNVSPAQFLGLEIKRWAREIAELVLWIGYLQWHYRTHGNVAPREPVLRDYKNIQCRDAVLTCDRQEVILDENHQAVTHWDGRTMKKSPVTGEDVPDETARVPVMRLVNPRKATWPDADFIVGNPPFIGNKRMRLALGDGYVEALRAVHDEVAETSDYVMYWWNHAAELVRAGNVRRFGLITTNSITQTFNRKVVQRHLEAKNPLSIVFAVPDHPWVDSESGAAVRIAITVVEAGDRVGLVREVVQERESDGDHVEVELSSRTGLVHADLSAGPDVVGVEALQANKGLSYQGPILVGEGFRMSRSDAQGLGLDVDRLPGVLRPYVIGRDITQIREERYAIDFFGLSEVAARASHPKLFQWILDRVKPMRDQVKRKNHRENWWIFGEARPGMRRALVGLPRFVVTAETSKHKPFVFQSSDTIPDHKLYVIASDDAWVLGVLSSRVHGTWARAAGGRLGVGNDPTWTNSTCFLPFPFPEYSVERQSRIRTLGESLDAHRKRQQTHYSDLTITGMYNVLEKLRSGEKLSTKDLKIHEQGLVSVLKQIHDDLDAAVFDAYGWPADLTDEQILERLVALNAVRAGEEQRGLVRWLRPEFQNPAGTTQEAQAELAGTEPPPIAAIPASVPKWPTKLPAQFSAVRDLVVRGDASWSLEEVARQFKGAKRESVAAVLDSLAGLGLAVAFDLNSVRRWKALARAAA